MHFDFTQECGEPSHDAQNHEDMQICWQRHFLLWATLQKVVQCQVRGNDDDEKSRYLGKTYVAGSEQWVVEYYSDDSGRLRNKDG